MQRSSIFWGLMLLLAGVLFLLQNLGFLRVDVWGLLWPLFLIGMGLATLYGVFFRRGRESEHLRLPLEEAARARLRLQHGAGRLSVGPGAAPGDLLEGDFSGGVDVDTRTEGDTLTARLSTPPQGIPFGDFNTRLEWEIALSRETPLELEVYTGASEARLDLSELRLSTLQVKAGASSLDITLPAAAGETRARFQTGAAATRIRLPAGLAASIRTRGGVAAFNVNESRFPRSGQGYQSPDYASAPNRVDLEIESGVGAVTIE